MRNRSSSNASSNPYNVVIRVDARSPHYFPSLREIWQYREMLYFLVVRDIKIRYKQTVLGGLWAVIQPFMTMIVFTIFFSNVAKISSGEIPYPLFSFSALVPWTFFSNGVSLGADSIVGQAHLVRKVYFPRILIPLARILGGMVDYVLALALLIVMMFFYGYGLSWTMLLAIPFLSLMLVLIALGISLWLSALNVSYRDVHYLVPFLIQTLLFATPVIYPSNLIARSARIFYGLNPMVNVIDGFRWALLDTPSPPGPSIAISLVLVFALLISGLLFFSRAEGTFTDIV